MGLFEAMFAGLGNPGGFLSKMGVGKFAGQAAPMQGPMQPGHSWQPPAQQPPNAMSRFGQGLGQANQAAEQQMSSMPGMPDFSQGAGGQDGGLAALVAQYMQQSRRQ